MLLHPLIWSQLSKEDLLKPLCVIRTHPSQNDNKKGLLKFPKNIQQELKHSREANIARFPTKFQSLSRKPQRERLGKLKSASGRKPFESSSGCERFLPYVGSGERDRLICCVLVEDNELLEAAAFCENDSEFPTSQGKRMRYAYGSARRTFVGAEPAFPWEQTG